MNTEKNTINQKEETNSNDFNVSEKKYYSMKYIAALILLIATCFLSIIYFRTNLFLNNNENGDKVDIISVSKNPSRKKSVKPDAKKKEIIHHYVNDLLKSDEIFIDNLMEKAKQDNELLPGIIKQIEDINKYTENKDNVFDLIQSKINWIITGSESLLNYHKKQEAIKETKIEKPKEQSRNPRFLEEIIFNACYTKNCTDTCIHYNHSDPNLPILYDQSNACCMKCNLCCQCPSLWVNSNNKDLGGDYPERWTDYYKLQQIEHSLWDVANIAEGNILPGQATLSCPTPYEIFDGMCIPFIGKLCYDLYPEEGEYFKCKMDVNMKNNLLYCTELYYNQTRLDRDPAFYISCPYSAIWPQYGNCTRNFTSCFNANVGLCSTIE